MYRHTGEIRMDEFREESVFIECLLDELQSRVVGSEQEAANQLF